MEYNKTKRGLEKAAGIVGLVIAILEIILWAGYVVVGVIGVCGGFNYTGAINSETGGFEYVYNSMEGTFAVVLVLAIIMLTLTILTLVFASKVISSPVNADGTIQNRNSKRICMLVFSILTGSWVAAGLMIAVLSLKDFKEVSVSNENCVMVNPTINNNTKFNGANLANDNKANVFVQNILEVKHLHELGVIEAADYKKSIQKLVDKFISEE